MQGLIGFLLVLFVIALIVEFFWWIVGVLVVVACSVGAVALVVMLMSHASASAKDRDRRIAALVARAEQQHRWCQEGDLRGIYGQYPPVSLDG